MPVRPFHDSRPEASAATRAAATAGAIALVVTGASLGWAVSDVPRSADKVVTAGGSAAAVVIVVAVALAVFFAQAARRARIEGSSNVLQANRMAAEFDQLAAETIPSLVQRVRYGAQPDTILAGVPVGTPAVRNVLAAVVNEVATAGRRETEATAAHAALEAEVASLAGEALPAAIRQMHEGQSADTVLDGVTRPDSRALRDLLDTVVNEVTVAERRGAAAMAACASAAARIQAQTTRMLAELREMETRHGREEKVFADLMELDHRVSQMGRLADSIALLAGGRSGRRWTKPIPMESILRGAMSRIDAYRRVRLHSTSTAAVVGYASEGVMHALAELMDNAAAFSAYGSEVHVYVEEEDVGVVATIEDSGLGMRKRERGRAEALISQPFNLATLPGTRLGLAVVGRVADRYGLSVNFRPSSRGGTGVVVMIPRQLIAQQHEHSADDARAGAATFDRTPRGTLAEDWTGESVQEIENMAPDGDDDEELPVRPRGRTLASASVPGTEATAPPAPPQARDASSRFAAFREAGERTRSAPPAPRDETT